jgi:xylose isomerase
MKIVMAQDGLPKGGLNFDAKVRRESNEVVDLFYAHVGGMDVFAKGLLIAEKSMNARLENMRKDRYASWSAGPGKRILEEKTAERTSRTTSSKAKSTMTTRSVSKGNKSSAATENHSAASNLMSMCLWRDGC